MGKKQMAFIHEMDEKNHALHLQKYEFYKERIQRRWNSRIWENKMRRIPHTCIYNTCRRVFLKSVDSW